MEFTLYEEKDVFTSSELKPLYDERVEPGPNRFFVVANVEIENTGNSDLRIGRSQWSLTDDEGTFHSPHDEAMTKVEDTFPEDERLDPDATESYRVIVEVDRTYGIEFVMDPYLGTEGPTIILDPPTPG